MLEVGSTVDRWHIDAIIHQGSMAVTYAVSHEALPRAYAMKLLFLQEQGFQERLRRAGDALKGIRHPNLLPIVDVIEITGLVAVVSEFIEGTNAAGWCQKEPRSLTSIVQLFRKTALGLRAAHSHGLVHRNLKPAKVLVDLTDRPYIHDFMLGKVLSSTEDKAVTQMGTTFGTPQYMAPEQFRGAGQVDERADVFSMGCLLFEMVTNRRAFDGTGLMEIYKQVVNGDRPAVHELREDCPEALEALLVDMLNPDVDARMPSMKELVTRLDTDTALRSLVNPSFRTATPVAALTSERPVQRRVALDAPAEQTSGHQVLTVTPVEPLRVAESAGTSDAFDPDMEPTVFAEPSPLSEDSRPSLITFTDGHSGESHIGNLHTMAKLDAAPPPPRPPPPPGPSPKVLVGGLVVLFLVAMGIGFAFTLL